MISRHDVVCNACWGQVRDWTQTSATDSGAIYEGVCRDCSFHVRVFVPDDGGDVEIVMGGEIDE